MNRLTTFFLFLFFSLPCIGQKSDAQLDRGIFSKEDFSFIATKWKNCDGEECSIVSDWFCEILEWEPELFFSEIEKYPGLFEQWSERVTSLSLKNYGGCLNTECFRLTLVNNLKKWEAPDKHKEKKKKLLIIFENAKNLKVD